MRPSKRKIETACPLPVLAYFLVIFRRQFERAALVEAALQIVLRLKDRDVFVYRCQGRQFQTARDLLVAWTISVLRDERRDAIEHLLLPFGDRHTPILGE